MILKVTDKLPLPVAFVADTVTVVAAIVVGVPDIKPVLVFKDRPAGNALEL